MAIDSKDMGYTPKWRDNVDPTYFGGATMEDAVSGAELLCEMWNAALSAYPNIPEDSPELAAAKRDIAALLWLNGNCEYCAYGRKKEYSGAVRWECGLEPGTECAPEWRGVEMIDES